MKIKTEEDIMMEINTLGLSRKESVFKNKQEELRYIFNILDTVMEGEI